MIKYTYASSDKDGKKGDSKHLGEVKTANEYNFGQNNIIRPKDTKVGEKVSDISLKLSKLDNLGYSQSHRYGLWDLCVTCKWNVDKVLKTLESKKVDTDCSQFWACCVNLAFGKLMISKYNTTASARSNAIITKKFTILPYSKGVSLFKGDALVKPSKHMVIVTSKGKAGV